MEKTSLVVFVLFSRGHGKGEVGRSTEEAESGDLKGVALAFPLHLKDRL